MKQPHLSLTNQFLIAMPQLADPNFFQSVTYICQHDEEGALGIIINHPLEMELNEIFEHMAVTPSDASIGRQPVYFGGPVHQERGFVLHTPGQPWDSTLVISAEVALSTSRDIIAAMANQNGPNRTLVALGYAGWGPGQLEQEIADNAWLSGPARADIIFDLPPAQRWHAAASLIGVNLRLLSDDVGHA